MAEAQAALFPVITSTEYYGEIVDAIAAECDQGSIEKARNLVVGEIAQLYASARENAGIHLTDPEPRVVKRSGVVGLGLRSADEADTFAKELQRVASRYRSELPGDDGRRRLRIAIHGGPEEDALEILQSAHQLVESVPEDGILVSDYVRARLSAELQKKYVEFPLQDEDRDQNLRAYIFTPPRAAHPPRSEAVLAKQGRCFVIAPYDDRGRQIFDRFLHPACREAGFEARLARWDLSAGILSEMLAALRDEPMTLCYVGAPPWNANVMIEMGIRLAVGRPLVIVRDSVEPGEEISPFDLGDHRLIFLPTNADLEKDPSLLYPKISEIAQTIRARQAGPLWSEPHPCAAVRIDTDADESSYTDASKEAERIFQCQLTGQSVEEFVWGLSEIMEPAQFDAFVAEQESLMGQVLGFSFLRRDKVPVATIPIVIARHATDPSLVGRSYLPIIVRYWRQAGEALLKLLYLDVTSATAKRRDRFGREYCVAELADSRENA